VEQLERFAVQLVEAKRLAGPGDVAHTRLALLLLDNLAETLMYHMCATATVGDRIKERHLHLLSRLSNPSPEDLSLIEKVESQGSQPESEGQIIPDPRLVAAIVDRVTFHAHIIETGTDSYRLRVTQASRSRRKTA
jgi:IstB-like ATP binding protein